MAAAWRQYDDPVMHHGGTRTGSRKRQGRHACCTKHFMSGLSFVELGGLEPPSKHRTQKLSTRLFPL